MAVGLVPRERAAAIVEPRISLNYTTVLNVLFLALGVVLLVRFFRTNGLAMLRMMNEPLMESADGAERGAVEGSARTVSDPVCGMVVSRNQTTESARYRGDTFYFCSAECRRKFEANPERYAQRTA